MRYLLTLMLLTALVLPACNRQEEPPQTTALEPPTRTLESLQPIEEPGAEREAALAPAAPPVLYAPAVSVDPAPAAAGERTYVIQKGDTYIGIARRRYGDASRWRDIQAMNPGLNPNKLRIGQVIQLPAE
jgi:nucleoid-associated protein YgaU